MGYSSPAFTLWSCNAVSGWKTCWYSSVVGVWHAAELWEVRLQNCICLIFLDRNWTIVYHHFRILYLAQHMSLTCTDRKWGVKTEQGFLAQHHLLSVCMENESCLKRSKLQQHLQYDKHLYYCVVPMCYKCVGTRQWVQSERNVSINCIENDNILLYN